MVQNLILKFCESKGRSRLTADIGLSKLLRSIPDVDIDRSGVSNVAPISRIAAPAPGQKRT